MRGRISGGTPSAMRDAQFLDEVSHIPSGHMGPAYNMYWFSARIDIDPKDGPAWIARTRPTPIGAYWSRDANPLIRPGAAWSMSPAEFDGAAWYDPAPLFSSRAHGGYQGGHLAVTNGGATIFVWQHWR
jgi:hypothetical protein